MTATAYATTANVKLRLGLGTADTQDDTLIGSLVDQVNGWMDDEIGRSVAPNDAATFVYDGDGSDTLYIPNGIRSVTTLTIADSTGGAAVAETHYVILPRVQERRPGWPGFWLRLTDLAPVRFWDAFSNVSVTGNFGWEEIPDALKDVALTITIRAWHARQTGQADIVGNDEAGAPIVSRFVSMRDRKTIQRYKVDYLVAA